MPQLDNFTFLSQIRDLFITLFIINFLIAHKFVPYILLYFKYNKKIFNFFLRRCSFLAIIRNNFINDLLKKKERFFNMLKNFIQNFLLFFNKKISYFFFQDIILFLDKSANKVTKFFIFFDYYNVERGLKSLILC